MRGVFSALLITGTISVTAKLTGVIDISWTLATLPFWIVPVFLLAFIVGVAAAFAVAILIDLVMLGRLRPHRKPESPSEVRP